MIVLRPLTTVYSGLASLKNWLFDHQILKAHKVSCPVVAIGNLSVGGAGKTPIVDHFISWAKKHNIHPGVVSRGYGGHFRGVVQVIAAGSPVYFGDEPTMLAHRHPEVAVFVGADRVQAAEQLLHNNSAAVIFADDAFQHRRLYRDFNILVIDVTEDSSSWRPLPEGRLREKLSGMMRADAIFFTKVNLASPEQLKKVEALVDGVINPRSVAKVYCQYLISQIIHCQSGEVVGDWQDQPALLVSAIAKPKSFASSLAQAGQVCVRGHLVFNDHHKYTDNDIANILSAAKSAGVERIVVTEKDWIKLKNFSALKEFLYIARLELKLSGDIERVYASIFALTNS